MAHWGLLRQKKKEENVFTKSMLVQNAHFFYFVEVIASFYN